MTATKLTNDAYMACQTGNLVSLSKAVLNGFVPSDELQSCCLIYAVSGGHIKIIEFLISQNVDFRAGNDLALQIADLHSKMDVLRYLVSLGAPTDMLSDQNKEYISFCQKMEEKNRVRAQKKIYYWWIPICYDLNHPSGCGQRMALKNLTTFNEMMAMK